MSRIRVILNYVDVAHLLKDIKTADSFSEVVTRTNRLQTFLEDAAKKDTAEYLQGE